jgi:hypothetical protein
MPYSPPRVLQGGSCGMRLALLRPHRGGHRGEHQLEGMIHHTTPHHTILTVHQLAGLLLRWAHGGVRADSQRSRGRTQRALRILLPLRRRVQRGGLRVVLQV